MSTESEGNTIRTAERTTFPFDFFADALVFLVAAFDLGSEEETLTFLDGGVLSLSSLVVDLRFALVEAAFGLGLGVLLVGFTSSSEGAESTSSASCTTNH